MPRAAHASRAAPSGGDLGHLADLDVPAEQVGLGLDDRSEAVAPPSARNSRNGAVCSSMTSTMSQI